MTAGPPSKIQVGEHTFHLVMSADRCDDANSAYGFTRAASCEIVINPRFAPSQIRDTTFHELLHACIADSVLADRPDSIPGACLTEAMEEQVIRVLAPAVLALLRRNPRLVTYLTEKTP